jgi:hypothetical protein
MTLRERITALEAAEVGLIKVEEFHAALIMEGRSIASRYYRRNQLPTPILLAPKPAGPRYAREDLRSSQRISSRNETILTAGALLL